MDDIDIWTDGSCESHLDLVATVLQHLADDRMKTKAEILKHFSLFPTPLLGNCLCEFLLLLFVFRPRSKLDLLNYLKHFIHRLKMTKNSSISIHHFFRSRSLEMTELGISEGERAVGDSGGICDF